jgi:hypothetical protein
MSNTQKTKKPKELKLKGQVKGRPDNDNPEQNPLLHIENKHDFSIETANLLEDPDSLIYKGFDSFDLTKDKDHFDVEQLNNDSEIVVILKYFEYLCIAKFRFSYIKPILVSGFAMKDVFDMTKHSLKNRLLMNVPSFDTVFEPEIQYIGKIKYFDNNRY